MKTKSTILLMIMIVLVLALASCDALSQIPMFHEHTWQDATCEVAKTCVTCGETEGAPLGHVEEDLLGKAATCFETGLTDGKKCSVCDAITVAQTEIEKLPHTEETLKAKAPTCTDTGLTEGKKCSVCDEIIVAQETVKALGHTEETLEAKEPTCTDTGLTEGKKCSVCGVTTLAQEVITENGHKDDNGDYECDVCYIDLCTEHTPADAVEENRVEASCTEEGSYESVVKCSKCGDELSRETVTIPVVSHTEELVPGKANSCTDTGLTDGKKCSVCGEVILAQDVIPQAGHKDENGDYECDVCYTDLCTKHVEETVPGYAATCEATGLTDGKKCSQCGETTLAQEEIPAKGHSYVTSYVWAEDNSSCTAQRVCANDASHSESETAAFTNVVKLHVSATKVTFTYEVKFTSELYEAQTKSVEADVELVDSVATINAPAIEGLVASHDYVKFDFHNAEATHEFTIYYSECDVWDGVSVSESLAGQGTLENPYLIQSAADLAYVAQVVNALAVKTSAFGGNYFLLTKSIDLNDYELHIGTGSGWGTRQIFAGYLDGNNCTIRGINNTLSLFGCVEGGWVKNLSLYGNVNVAEGNDSIGVFVGYLRLAPLDNITNYATINGRGNVGGIVGNMEQSTDTPSVNLVNYGTVTGVQNVGGIAGLIGREIANATNWGTVSGNNNIGGIVGSLYWACTLTDCVNYGTVSGKTIVGGIAGVRNGNISATLTNCVNYSNVVGTSCVSTGIDGITSADVTKTDCVNNGSVVIPDHVLTHVDAKAATCDEAGNVAYDYCSVCEKNYDADGKVIANVVTPETGHNYVQGEIVDGKITFTCANCGDSYQQDAKYTITVNHLNIDGTNAADPEEIEITYGEIVTINAKALDNLVASHDYVKVHVLSDSSVTIYYSPVDVWDGTGTWDGTANVATSLASLGGSGTETDPYIIDEAQDLVTIANIVNSLAAKGSSALIKGKYFKMTKSIDLNDNPLYIGGYSGWNDRRIFDGHLDGNNCSIRGLNNDRALFGCIEGSVKNLSLYGKVNATASNGASLVAYLRGQVNYITNYAEVTAYKQAGGIIANIENKTTPSTHLTNYGNVTSLSNNGEWSAVGGILGCLAYNHSDMVNWGDIICDGTQAGGIAGYGHDSRAGTLTNAYNYGKVYCAATATGQIVGGIGGHTLSNCHEYGEVVTTLPTEE